MPLINIEIYSFEGGNGMKYRILLAGNNQIVLDDFFYAMSNDFECQTTSWRFEDIECHLKYFTPDIFIYGLREDFKDNIAKIMEARGNLQKKKIPFVVIGSKEDCDNFVKVTINLADLILAKPLTAAMIEERIVAFLTEKQRREAEEKKRMELERRQKAIEAEKNRRKHIIVVDDDPRMLKLIKEHLHEDYDIATAINGKLALKFLEKKRTDLIFLDYEMPDMNGPQVLEKIRENQELSDIPVVFLTGISEREKIEKVLSMKPQGYVLKPIDREKLITTIKNVLG